MNPGRLPSLAVVVPTLDEEVLLPRLLARLASGSAQDRADQVVVADGGSRDATQEIARGARAEVVVGATGRGTQMAAGARRCRAELLVFLHADCVPEPGALAHVRAFFARSGEVVAAGMRQRIEAEGRFYRWVEAAADRRVARGRIWGDSALCVRRSTYEEVGGFAALPLFEDVEISRRLRAAGPSALITEAVLAVSARRWRAEGAWRATVRNKLLYTCFALGVEPSRLIRYYKRGRSTGARRPGPS